MLTKGQIQTFFIIASAALATQAGCMYDKIAGGNKQTSSTQTTLMLVNAQLDGIYDYDPSLGDDVNCLSYDEIFIGMQNISKILGLCINNFSALEETA